jgi:hypothetical protein
MGRLSVTYIHGNIEDMQKACRSGFMHVSSTDEEPNHVFVHKEKTPSAFITKRLPREKNRVATAL